ncbi:hypothetical protein Q31b_35300 [Novipirellula aureliae]|uniref:Uncharacterized protein n=1 Tax=Novipirellula aureliae TaxID=2527966 RepID=A0A5C6DV22_9BACT|nr:hypothetical protein [Novipirellula aureliae]TWU40185.1 hypothetical protein Q31b_35300 [Novipirellula aureliae]
MKFICDVRQVNDLAEGETAAPEPDMGYELRSIAGYNFEAGLVEYLVRHGDVIFARTIAGEEFAITGRNAHVLVPLGF